MSKELDDALGRLSAVAQHPELARIEQRVFVRVLEEAASAAQTAHRVRVGAVVAIGALMLGMVLGSPVSASSSAETLAPFGPSSPLAPSSLLAGDT